MRYMLIPNYIYCTNIIVYNNVDYNIVSIIDCRNNGSNHVEIVLNCTYDIP